MPINNEPHYNRNSTEEAIGHWNTVKFKAIINDQPERARFANQEIARLKALDAKLNK